MDAPEFKTAGKSLVQYICKYYKDVKDMDVVPDVKPGFLTENQPMYPPEQPQKWDDVIQEFDDKVMPGMTHWQHPDFHGFYPSGNSYPSIIGDMLSDAIGSIGFNWDVAPAGTELEFAMVDWMGKMMHLPDNFINSKKLGGGGSLQNSSSESIVVVLIAARYRIMTEWRDDLKETRANTASSGNMSPTINNFNVNILPKLVVYCSELADPSIDKAAVMLLVKVRRLKVDSNYSLTGATLRKAIHNDMENGLIPFFVVSTMGTIGLCSFDNLEEIIEVCNTYGVWLHVDAAYAGCGLICDELRNLYGKGLEHIDSMNVNPYNLLLINFDCSLLWVRNIKDLLKALTVDPVYLQNKHSKENMDLRNWSTTLSRRFRALKIWFTLRTYGINGLQNHIKNHMKLAKIFEGLVKQNEHFEIVGNVTIGLVCFRLKPKLQSRELLETELNHLNESFLININETGQLMLTPYELKDGMYFIRFCVCREQATVRDVRFAWKVICDITRLTLIANGLLDRNMREITGNVNSKLSYSNKTPRQRYLDSTIHGLQCFSNPQKRNFKFNGNK